MTTSIVPTLIANIISGLTSSVLKLKNRSLSYQLSKVVGIVICLHKQHHDRESPREATEEEPRTNNTMAQGFSRASTYQPLIWMLGKGCISDGGRGANCIPSSHINKFLSQQGFLASFTSRFEYYTHYELITELDRKNS